MNHCRWIVAVLALLFGSRAYAAETVPAAVLAAEADRVATIKKITPPTIAIFDRQGQGGGSGVIISADGYALTNYHVTAPCGPAMKCGLADGRLLDAVLVGLDPGGDIALVKLLPPESSADEQPPRPLAFPVAELGDSDLVRVGDWAYVAGNPFLLADNYQPTISYGIISGVHRYQYPAGTLLEYTDCLQTDAAVNPGNSGGPLFNAQGQLIGINGRCSFEKRGRVNVGVGYSVSINQIKRFLSHLKSGRLVDHASLGAVVSTDSEGRVIVNDILEDSDAYRRGLRFGDEIVRFGSREITTANDLKNILGTYPAGWRVPLAYRRDGREYERLVRLAPAHRDGELAAMIDSESEPDDHGDAPPESPEKPKSPHRVHAKVKKADELPAEVAAVFQQRSGYANAWFNRAEQERIWNAYRTTGDLANRGWNWTVRGTDDSGGAVEIKLTEQHGAIVMPAGKSEAEFGLSLANNVSPPRSGGLLAALHLWQQLVLNGPRQFGDLSYFGALPWPDQQQLADCLVGVEGGVDSRFYFDPQTGRLVGIEMQTADGEDPCEIYFSDFRDHAGCSLPFRWVIRHGDTEFADLTITTYDFAAASPPDSPAPPQAAGDSAPN